LIFLLCLESTGKTESFSTASAGRFDSQSALASEAASRQSFARIGKEFMAFPRLSQNNPEQDSVMVLPYAPAAVALTFIGFLCVSVSRDRKAWFSAMLGLFTISQCGIKCVLRAAGREFSNSECGSYEHAICKPDRQMFNGSIVSSLRYLGLLHRLAEIPDRAVETCFANVVKGLSRLVAPYQASSTFYRPDSIASDQEAISAIWSEFIMSLCRQRILAQLARGPPVSISNAAFT
jgi:hypothetical protein